jgi:hypothetical protein
MLARKRQRPKVGQTRGDGKSKNKNKSWMPGRKGQGGEGLSDGYGGSAGDGTGASGPAEKRGDTEAGAANDGDHDYSAALPSRDRIAKVLR